MSDLKELLDVTFVHERTVTSCSGKAHELNYYIIIIIFCADVTVAAQPVCSEVALYPEQPFVSDTGPVLCSTAQWSRVPFCLWFSERPQNVSLFLWTGSSTPSTGNYFLPNNNNNNSRSTEAASASQPRENVHRL